MVQKLSCPGWSWTDRRPGGTPSSRVWAPGIIQDQGVSGEFGGPRLRKQATANCSANHSVSSWGWMELARAGRGSLQAHSLPVSPLSSLKSGVHLPADSSHPFLCRKLAWVEFNGW